MHQGTWGWVVPLAFALGGVGCDGDDSGGDADVASEDGIGDTEAGADADADGGGDEVADAEASDATGEGGDEVAGDAGADAEPGPGDWSCLGSVVFPAPTESTADYATTITDFATGVPLEGVSFRACERSDEGCAAPLDAVTTDAAGQAAIILPLGASGFDGYFDLRAAGYIPQLRWPFPPVTEVTATGDHPAVMVSLEGISSFAESVGVTLDAGRGQLFVTVLDCAGTEAEDIRGEVDTADGSSTLYFLIGEVPDTTVAATDASGALGWFNLPPGAMTLTLRSGDAGVEVARASLLIRAGALTTVELPPTPLP